MRAVFEGMSGQDAVGRHEAQGLADRALGEVGAGGDVGDGFSAGGNGSEHGSVAGPVGQVEGAVMSFGALVDQLGDVAEEFSQAPGLDSLGTSAQFILALM